MLEMLCWDLAAVLCSGVVACRTKMCLHVESKRYDVHRNDCCIDLRWGGWDLYIGAVGSLLLRKSCGGGGGSGGLCAVFIVLFTFVVVVVVVVILTCV